MKLLTSSAAITLLLLPIGSFAVECYYCANSKMISVAPTYKCGKDCGLDNYDTRTDGYHCWNDGDGADSCFKNCCENADKLFTWVGRNN